MKRRRNVRESAAATSKRVRQEAEDVQNFKNDTFAEAAEAAAVAATATIPTPTHSESRRRVKKQKEEDGVWGGEQDYEQVPRAVKINKTTLKLPIRDGEKKQWSQVEVPVEEKVDDADMDDDSDDSDGSDKKEDVPIQKKVVKPVTPQMSPKEQIFQAKEKLAKVAMSLNESPEENVGGLKDLQDLAESDNYKVQQLALMTQLTVYKDLIPGYRIRPISETDGEGKVSRDIRKLREYEQRLVAGYKKFVDTLSALTKTTGPTTRSGELKTSTGSTIKRDSKASAALSSVAVTCACDLIVAVPHFNFRVDLITILTRKLSVRHRSPDLDKCVAAFEQLFRDDEDGYASTEAVAMLARMIKARKLSVHESTLNVFLQLRLLGEFSRKGSAAGIDRAETGNEEGDPLTPAASAAADKLNSKKHGRKVKRLQQNFRTKKERKHMKDMKELESEMAEADATVSHEDRERMQAESLKLVFGIYFRILKARVRYLMGAVLEGLARYAHLINQDFFGDIVEALRELVSEREAEALAKGGGAKEEEGAEENGEGEGEAGDGSSSYDGSAKTRDAAREALLCAITAFALLDGQQGVASGASPALSLDLSFFVGHLYRTLLSLSIDPDIDLSYRRVDQVTATLTSAPTATTTAHPLIAPAPNRVNFQTTIVLLIRCLSSTLLPTHQALRSVPPVRLAAFCKRLLTLSTQLPEKSAVAVLGLVNQVVKAHGRRIAGLWYTEERRADGLFDPLRPDLEASNPFATTVWEGEILRMHYCPTVRKVGKAIEKGIMVAAQAQR